jgi:hypothetical protein
MKIRFLVLILILFASKMNAQECSGCNKRTKFKFILLKTKGVKIDTTIAKTNGVYLRKYFRINLDKTQQDIYHFYRFFENGKVYMSCGYCSLPSEKEFNELKYGSYGEYRIENNQIIIEYYGSYVGYYLSYWKTENNKLIETNTSKRKLKGKVKLNNSYIDNEYEYKFYKCNLNTNSFW